MRRVIDYQGSPARRIEPHCECSTSFRPRAAPSLNADDTALEGQRHALIEAEGETAASGPIAKAIRAEQTRALAIMQALAGKKVDRQAAKHEAAQGRPELAKRIEDNAGEEALRRAGGLRPVAGSTVIPASGSAAKREGASPSTPHADAAPITSDQ